MIDEILMVIKTLRGKMSKHRDLLDAVNAHLTSQMALHAHRNQIVQAQDAPTAEFQNALKAAGAQIVAYVPNNAFLVKAGTEEAANLQSVGGVRSVLPYEPYYKIDTRLMKFAVDHETMADGAWLRVTLFPGRVAGSSTGFNSAGAAGGCSVTRTIRPSVTIPG